MDSSINLKKNKTSTGSINISYALKKEFFRKTIHMIAAFVPFFYYFSQTIVMTLLFSVTLLYGQNNRTETG